MTKINKFLIRIRIWAIFIISMSLTPLAKCPIRICNSFFYILYACVVFYAFYILKQMDEGGNEFDEFLWQIVRLKALETWMLVIICFIYYYYQGYSKLIWYYL
jgi:hypothetical protein